MRTLTQLRTAAREMLNETLRAVDPTQALRKALRVDVGQLHCANSTFDIGNRPIYSVAIGKAAVPLAYGLEQTLGESFTAGFMSASFPRTDPLALKGIHEWLRHTRWHSVEGGHPLPNEASLQAASEVFRLLDEANKERALLIFLISGGGSAMIEWPINDAISLSDLRSANKVLVNSGASIAEINAVRRTFSAVKGGKLATRVATCDQFTFIVSDVREGEEWNVASGPTLAPPSNAFDPNEVIARYHLRTALPPPIVDAIDNAKESADTAASRAEYSVLLSNRDALTAAAESARRHEFIPEIAWDISDQPIDRGCELLLRKSLALRGKYQGAGKASALISGGEFACRPQGDGAGGRSLETALRLALLRKDSNPNDQFVALCAGTDGIDGNSPAAGAIVDSATIERANAAGLNPHDYLKRSDAYSFFAALGDTIETGMTGTNVRDLRILL